jgi:hypothetical protein
MHHKVDKQGHVLGPHSLPRICPHSAVHLAEDLSKREGERGCAAIRVRANL